PPRAARAHGDRMLHRYRGESDLRCFLDCFRQAGLGTRYLLWFFGVSGCRGSEKQLKFIIRDQRTHMTLSATKSVVLLIAMATVAVAQNPTAAIEQSRCVATQQPRGGPEWNGWSDLSNTRFQSAAAA